MSKFSFLFNLNPEKALVQNNLFWTATLLPVLLFLILSIPIIREHWWAWDFSSIGYLTFTSDFKFPLAVLGLSWTLVILVGVHHRSLQQVRSMELQKRQNSFSNYLTHWKFFYDESKSALPASFEKSFTSGQIRRIHRYLFPNAREGNFDLNNDLLTTLRGLESYYIDFPAKEMRYLNLTTILLVFSIFKNMTGYHPSEKIAPAFDASLTNTSKEIIELLKVFLLHTDVDTVRNLNNCSNQLQEFSDDYIPENCANISKYLLDKSRFFLLQIWTFDILRVLESTDTNTKWDRLIKKIEVLNGFQLSRETNKLGKSKE